MIRACIMIPTYNEKENIGILIDHINAINLSNVLLDILVIDDNSPDGTGVYVKNLPYSNVFLLERTNKEGLGKAYLAGIRFLIKKDIYTHLISMDADGSHQVSDLKSMINEIQMNQDVSLVIGSRWVSGGSVVNWPWHRKILSILGSAYARKALKMNIRDVTGGFKIYQTTALKRINLEKIVSNGYCFQIEITRAVSQLDEVIKEMPITFVERKIGQSKMNLRIVIEAMWQVTKWALQLRLNPNADKLHYVK